LDSFEYLRASDLEEAVDYLSDGNGKALAGGTDLVIQLKQRKVRPRRVVDVTRIPELRQLGEKGGHIVVGAAVTFQELAASPLIRGQALPLFQMAMKMGSLQVRNVATLGGNIANGSPSADSVVPLLALGTSLILANKQGRREKPLAALMQSEPGRVALNSDEIILEMRFPQPLSATRGIFIKLGRRNAVNIARLSLCAVLSVDPMGKIARAAISVGSASPHPFRIESAENLLLGSSPSSQLLDESVEEVAREVGRILGTRVSAPYKSLAIRGLVREALEYSFNLG
jgi:carbon-monoxide dehydrogenase medium subunit